MFVEFFYKLREAGIPVSPTAFLTLQKALRLDLINSLEDFYTGCRAILVKSERYFDLYDRIFAHCFQGAELPLDQGMEIDDVIRSLLDEWLKNPKQLAAALGLDEATLAKLSPEELIEYLKERLKEQKERHDGGNKWIGTGGTSPVGHAGYHPGGLRIGGTSQGKSAVKVAMERRYRDYTRMGPLTQASLGEALKRLRNLVPAGPKDQVNIEESIYQTMKNAGEIEIVFDRGLRDRLKVILAIDNGGWSMDPHIPVVQTLFNYARSQFKDLKIYYFHNTIYSNLWEDPNRSKKPKPVEEFTRMDPETRLIIVGDASMAPYELLDMDGSIYISEKSGTSSFRRLNFLADTFPHRAWLNPVPQHQWHYVHTLVEIARLFPMFPLTMDGLEAAVTKLMAA